MRLSRTISIFLIVAFCSFVGADGFAESPQQTEKIKIISACCINGKWTFNLYDGVSGKTISLKQGRRHASGYQVKSFDESTQTAVVHSPYGTFTITMNEHKANANITEPIEEKTSENINPAQTENTENPQSTPKTKTISRKQILERIK